MITIRYLLKKNFNNIKFNHVRHLSNKMDKTDNINNINNINNNIANELKIMNEHLNSIGWVLTSICISAGCLCGILGFKK